MQNAPASEKPQGDFYNLELERSIVVGFRREAALRHTTPPQLIRRILRIIIDDKLTGALLDD
jgi:hypothetical protein